MKCLVSYKRNSTRYNAGQDYDIDKAQAKADSKYFGKDLWAGADKKPAEKKEATPKKKAGRPRKVEK